MEDNKQFEAQELEAEEKEQTVIEETVEENSTETPAEEKTTRSEKKKAKKAEAELEEMKKALLAKDTELAELTDKFMRISAEYENFRKRSVKEREGIYADAYIDAVKDILPILDNMERALQYKDAQSGDGNMAKGLEMIMKSFEESLAKMGVSEIKALGETFDPNLHNAIMHIDDEQFGEGEIVEVFMKGYVKGDKVIRYSVVKVAN